MGTGSRTAIYARISKARDDEDSAGVDRQQADCLAYAEDHHLDVIGTYVDNDQSAMTGRRPEYRRLLADVEAGLVDVIVVWSADRLYRRLSDLEELCTRLNGTRVATIKSGDVDLSTADGRMVARLLGSVALRESEKMSERIARAAEQRARDGGNPGGERRFGYSADGTTVVPAEAALLAQAAERVLAGWSLNAVSRDWRERGISGADGGIVTGSQVGKMLRRPHYAGLATYRGRIVGTLSDHPPILTVDQHHRLVALLSDPDRRTERRGRPGTTLLGEVCYCEVCGNRMGAQSRPGARGEDGKPAKVLTYSCRTGHVTRDREPLDDAVTEVLLGWLEDNAAALRRPARPARATSKAAAEADRLREKLAAMPALLAGDTGMDPADYAAAVRALRERLAVVEAGLARSSTAPAAAGIVASGDVRAAWQAASPQARRAVVREAIDRIDVAPGHRPGTAVTDGVRIVPRSL